MTYPGGYTCSVCGTWVQNGVIHSCGGTPWTYPQPVPSPTFTFFQTGWKCPSCGAGVAPFMPYCPHCAPTKDTPEPDESEATSA